VDFFFATFDLKNPIELRLYFGEKMERTNVSLFYEGKNRTPLLCTGTSGGLVPQF